MTDLRRRFADHPEVVHRRELPIGEGGGPQLIDAAFALAEIGDLEAAVEDCLCSRGIAGTNGGPRLEQPHPAAAGADGCGQAVELSLPVRNIPMFTK